MSSERLTDEQRGVLVRWWNVIDTLAGVVERIVAEHRAEAWDEGYRSGHSNAMRRMSDEPGAPNSPNPYRAEAGSHEGAPS